MLNINRETQDRLVMFVSDYIRVLNQREPASITDEEYLLEMEAHSLIKKIDDNR